MNDMSIVDGDGQVRAEVNEFSDLLEAVTLLAFIGVC
jgi:hypothetical protein